MPKPQILSILSIGVKPPHRPTAGILSASLRLCVNPALPNPPASANLAPRIAPAASPGGNLTAPNPQRVALFATCIIDQLYPQVGVSVVRTLRRHGVSVDFPAGQTCCGQPLYNAGFTAQARQLATRVLNAFAHGDGNGDADQDVAVVVPSGSCGAMLRVFYLDLFANDPDLLPKAQSLAARTYEYTEFLAQLIAPDGDTDANADTPVASAAGTTSSNHPTTTVTYHPSCHLLRELGVRNAPRQLLAAVPGLAVAELPDAEQCCGFGGAFAVKYPHISEQMLADKLDAITASGADTLTACDLGCLMHIDGGVSRRHLPIRVRHIAQLLDDPTS